MNDQKPTLSDPTPQQRVGDTSIRPVVIGFVVTILIILVAALIFIKARQNKVVPKANDSPPTSQITQPTIPIAAPSRLAIAA
jgi:Na+-transporting methylmalonyl-CoA/oxaloacetate decarboxylase gamma subunit